jgi:tetratricopeptide (TPR) repeat protein
VLLLLNNHRAFPVDEAFALAEESLDKALLLNPTMSQAYAVVGLLNTMAWREGRDGSGLEKAEAALVRALDLNPNNASAFMWFASVRGTENQIEEAINLYHQSLRVDPLGKIPYANLPGLYAQRGQNEEALNLYVKAVEIHPGWPTAYRNLSLQLQGLGRMDEAVAWARKAMELSADPVGRTPMVSPYLEFGDYDKIRSLFTDVAAGHPLYEYGLGVEKAMIGDFAGAADIVERSIEGVENPGQSQLSLITTFAMLAGDFVRARKYAELHDPDFVADADLEVRADNVSDLIRYAFILQNQGENVRGQALLDSALAVVRTLPRVGLFGHGIRDVQILALLGKTREALDALRDAIDEGFRGTVTSNGWPLALDPYLNSLRGQPGFEAMVGELEGAIAQMQQRVAQAEESGDWDELRALVETGRGTEEMTRLQ